MDTCRNAMRGGATCPALPCTPYRYYHYANHVCDNITFLSHECSRPPHASYTEFEVLSQAFVRTVGSCQRARGTASSARHCDVCQVVQDFCVHAHVGCVRREAQSERAMALCEMYTYIVLHIPVPNPVSYGTHHVPLRYVSYDTHISCTTLDSDRRMHRHPYRTMWEHHDMIWS